MFKTFYFKTVFLQLMFQTVLGIYRGHGTTLESYIDYFVEFKILYFTEVLQ